MNTTSRTLSSFALVLTTALPALAQTSPALDWYLDRNPPSHYGGTLVAFPGVGTVLFGGGNMDFVDSTWVWNDGWNRLEPAHRPSPRANAGLAYDSLRNRLVLFGGRNRTTLFGDTWAFDGGDWVQLNPLTPPPPRFAADLVHDASRDRIVMRGGALYLQSITTAELWEFDGAAWTQPPQTGDVPAAGGFYVYDAARNETLSMHSGVLRAWNGTTWSLRSTAGLPASRSGRLVYDPASTLVLMPDPFGANGRTGSMHAYDGQGWTTIPANVIQTTHPLLVAVDPARGEILGWELPSSGLTDLRCDTWRFSGTGWERMRHGAPPPRGHAAMAYDSLRQRLVLHGGVDATYERKDTMELDGSVWRVMDTPAGQGPQNSRHDLSFDEARGVTVMFGGNSAANFVGEWSGGGWTFQTPSFRPPARSNTATCYDRTRARTLAFGGWSAGGLLNDLWAWNGLAWSNLSPPTSPPARYGTALSHDAPRDRVVLFGGTDGTLAFADTWEFDGVHWHQSNPTTAPPARFGHVQAFDGVRAFTVVFGGSNGTTDLRDTWTWDGTSWTQLITSRAPDVGSGLCGAFDARRQELVVFGGADSRGETWRLGDPTLGVVTSRGHGCDLGRGDLRLASPDEMRIDQGMRLQFDRLPTHFALLASAWAGFQDQQWNGAPLPYSLANLGAPACFVWADAAVPFWLENHADGSAVATVAIPNAPHVVGLPLYLQAVAWDLTTGAFGTANALQGRIGGP